MGKKKKIRKIFKEEHKRTKFYKKLISDMPNSSIFKFRSIEAVETRRLTLRQLEMEFRKNNII